MIKEKAQLIVETVSNARGGNGDIFRQAIFTPEQMHDKGLVCAVMTIPPGSSIGHHAHNPDAELYYILSGTLRITDDDVTKDLTAGDAVFTGGGSTHSAENVSNEDAVMLAFVVK